MKITDEQVDTVCSFVHGAWYYEPERIKRQLRETMRSGLEFAFKAPLAFCAKTQNWACPVNADRTYAPDARACAVGHPFHSEADCVMPYEWDNFMCRRCLIAGGYSTDPAAWDYNGEEIKGPR